MAGWTGLEPAASGVTGRRYNQLNYHPNGERPSSAAVSECQSVRTSLTVTISRGLDGRQRARLGAAVGLDHGFGGANASLLIKRFA